jgi:hypothetical protein
MSFIYLYYAYLYFCNTGHSTKFTIWVSYMMLVHLHASLEQDSVLPPKKIENTGRCGFHMPSPRLLGNRKSLSRNVYHHPHRTNQLLNGIQKKRVYYMSFIHYLWNRGRKNFMLMLIKINSEFMFIEMRPASFSASEYRKMHLNWRFRALSKEATRSASYKLLLL